MLNIYSLRFPFFRRSQERVYWFSNRADSVPKAPKEDIPCLAGRTGPAGICFRLRFGDACSAE